MNLASLHFQALLDAQRMEDELIERFMTITRTQNRPRKAPVADALAKAHGISSRDTYQWLKSGHMPTAQHVKLLKKLCLLPKRMGGVK